MPHAANNLLTDAHIAEQLHTLAEKDTHIKAAVALVGLPAARHRPHGFATLLDTIIGQQISVAAARAVRGRIFALMDDAPTPKALMTFSDEELRGAGLSRQKIGYARSLSEATLSGALNFDALLTATDDEATKSITQVKGLGVWSAQIYLMFALGRANIWPVLDLGVQEGVARFAKLDERPKPKALEGVGERWHPYRSAVALLAWHYYDKAPL